MVSKYGYHGNPNLRRAYVKVPITLEQEAEILKCANDITYFTKNYMKIVTLDNGIQSFNLWPFQEKMITAFTSEQRFFIAKLPRQSGKTSTTVAFCLHHLLFNKAQTIALVAHKLDSAKQILARLKLAYEKLPIWLQQGVIEWHKESIHLDNDSKIGAFATTAEGLRSWTCNIVVLDEFAFVANNIAEEFFTSTFPVISTGKKTKIIILSTPKGMNHFHEMWVKANHEDPAQRSGYMPFEILWNDVPGRDDEWKRQTIAATSEQQFDQEFNASFIGSSDTLISPQGLLDMQKQIKAPIISDNSFDIWEKPIEGKTYCICVDTSEGQGNDYSAFTVIDVSAVPYRVVAKYRNSTIPPLLYPTAIYQKAIMYNEAFVFLELNNNGQQIADILHFELSYENIIKTEVKGKFGQTVTGGFGSARKIQFGLKQSVTTKKVGCANLKTIIESGKLIHYDKDIMREFFTFVADKNTFKAQEGDNDDLVMSLVLFGWLVSQRYFKESTANNIRQIIQEEMMNISDADLLPAPILGSNIYDEPIEEDGELWMPDNPEEMEYPFNSTHYRRKPPNL